VRPTITLTHFGFWTLALSIFGAFFRASGASAFLPGARGGSPGARAEGWVPPDAGGAGVVRGQGPLKAPRP